MANCSDSQKDITADKFGAKLGVGIITVIYFVFILFIIGVVLTVRHKPRTTSVRKAPPVKQHNTDRFTGRFADWFTKVGNTINSGSILAILSAGVIIGFNGLIMTPLIATVFPVDIGEPIQIPGRTNVFVSPGQFFIALFGFVLSLIMFFFIAEGIYIIKRYFGSTLLTVILTVLFAFLTFMLVWNAMEADKILKRPDCVPIGTSTVAFQMRNGEVPVTVTASPVPRPPQSLFGVFG